MPRFSIVTPTFNQAATIRQTIESVLSQDFDDLDYWVFDAGSKDGTVDILRSFEGDSRFHWVSEPDRGQSDAINKGPRPGDPAISSTGSTPTTISRPVRCACSPPRGKRTATPTSSPAGRPSSAATRPTSSATRNSSCAARRRRASTSASTVSRAPSGAPDIFREFGGVDPALHCMMDWNLWVRYLARHGQKRVVLLDAVCAYFRHHAQAKTTAIAPRFYDEAKMIFQNLLLTIDAPPDFLIPEARTGRRLGTQAVCARSGLRPRPLPRPLRRADGARASTQQSEARQGNGSAARCATSPA